MLPSFLLFDPFFVKIYTFRPFLKRFAFWALDLGATGRGAEVTRLGATGHGAEVSAKNQRGIRRGSTWQGDWSHRF